MIQRTFPRTGWSVSVIGFGAWGIAGQWGPVEARVADATIKAAQEAGINFFDTADIYGFPPGTSEKLVGAALKGVRGKVFIATKVGYLRDQFEQTIDFSRVEHVERCCEASLARLGTDVIDLYQCHVGIQRDASVFLEAFEGLMKKGKIRAFGISTNVLPVAQAFNATGKLASVQLDYSVLNRVPERELLPYCGENQLAVIVRGPLARGVAAGKFSESTRFSDSVRESWNAGEARREFLKQLKTVEKLRWLERSDRTLAQAALQFVLAHPAVHTAIPGAKTPEQARANAAAGDAELGQEEVNRIRASTPSPTTVRLVLGKVRRALKRLTGGAR